MLEPVISRRAGEIYLDMTASPDDPAASVLNLHLEPGQVVSARVNPDRLADEEILEWSDEQLWLLTLGPKLRTDLPSAQVQKLWESISARRRGGTALMLARIPELSVDEDVPRQVLHAARKLNDATYGRKSRIDWVDAGVVGPSWLIAPILSVAAGIWWFDSALTWWHLITLAAIGFVLLAIQLYPFESAWRLMWLAVVLGLVAVAILVVVTGRDDQPPLILEVYTELLLAVLLLAVIGDLAHRLKLAWQSRLGRAVAVEQLAVDFIDLAWLAYLGRPPSRSRRSRDLLLKEIEQVAVRTEWTFRNLGPPRDHVVRAWSDDLGRRLGETIRRHKAALYNPATGPYGIAQSLLNGAAFALRHDFDALTAYPPPSRGRSILRAIMPRAATAGALFLAGLATTLLSLDNEQQLRNVLWIAALTALISPNLDRLAGDLGDSLKPHTGT
jgi:hypothetical protein